MSMSTRAFLGLSLLALMGAAALHMLALLGVAVAWGAMVHLTLFGWITGMITAITYHTTPVFAARDFPDHRLAWYHLGALGAGLLLATAGLLLHATALVLAGVGLQICAALLFTMNIISLFRRGAPRPGRPPLPPIATQPQIDRIGTQATRNAGLCLPLALLLLFGAYGGWLHGEWVLAAEHLAAVGWIMLTIVGVMYHMLPRFNGRGVRGPGWARAQLVCHIGALLLMVPALGLGLTLLFAVGGLMMTVAVGLFMWTVWPALQPQRLQPNAVPLMLKERPQ
jgi:hypothetical protein